ncbi:MAG: hypothetical protein AAFS10_14135 [Myxococcota bacterium]
MGADLIVDHSCQAKEALGDGDVRAGTAHILALLRKRNRAAAVMRMMPDTPPNEVEFVVMVVTPDGPKEHNVNAGSLLAEAAALDEHAMGCASCPANVLGQPYGCFGFVPYPIPAATEQALAERLEPVERLGGHLFIKALIDFGYDGSPIRQWRQRGLLEEDGEAVRPLSDKLSVTSSVLLQPILAVGGELGATHCLLVLMWFGALAFDGVVPDDPDDPAPLIALTSSSDTTKLDLVPLPDPVANTIARFMHRAGVLDVSLWVDA